MTNRSSRKTHAMLRVGVAIQLYAILAICVFQGTARADSTEAAAFAASGAAHEIKGAPGIYEWSYQATVGKSPFDKIGLHRTAKGPNPPAHPDAVVLYLPGTNMNGEVALEDPRYSFQLYLASHGVDVWAMDYRTHFIPPATAEKDLSELAGWTNDLFESDIDAAAKFVREQTGREKIFVAGFSRGVEFSYLYAAMHPDRVQGIIALDGFIPLKPMRKVAAPADHFADDIGGAHLTYDKRKVLMQMVIDNPAQAAPIPKYKTARENLEHVVYGAGGFFGTNGGLANPQGGFSDAVVLAKLLISYDRYWPAVQDGENPFTPALLEQLKTSKIPVIAFASTNFGSQWPTMVEAAAKSTGAPDPSYKKFDGWGHLDVLAGAKSETEVFAPTLAWIKQHLT
ncbi:MAG: alpha/beta fold hydrolase [Candidatus Binatus sp.]|uniref:alpha/beta hydrolase n=1 Tax=Candidatus Binatus sp. TaxID=2811406 RepID=UPI002721E6A1|nr:alpha/beta fold hydrolase [Candidatus Binatus sp.]MDO8433072.1 alpha/beta fold hydrolase [Candidatus Binatus sp.]